MADPILPGFIKAQVVLASRSNLPEDVTVNNFYFRDDTGIALGWQGAIARQIEAFYNGATPAAVPLASFLSSVLSGSAEIRMYDLGQAVPREPFIHEFALAGIGTSALPSEVAAVLSFYADRNLPRRRGRVYIGPLHAGTAVASMGRVALSDALMTALVDRGANMRDSTENAKWCMVSQAGLSAHVVTHVWCDDAPDTQRRRGRAATKRFANPAV